MYKKWKSVAALSMAVLIGCMMPVDTMIVAAEENQEDVQETEVDSVSDNDAVDDDGAILDGENAGDEMKVDDGIIDDEENVDDEIVDDDNVGDETDADEDENADDETSADEDENADEEVNTGNDGIALMSEAEELETGDTEIQASTAAPVINITWQGKSCITYNLDNEVDYKYINNRDQAFECSASQDGQPISFYYYLDKTEGTTIKTKGIGDITSWTEGLSYSVRIPFEKDEDAIYVLYVKAGTGEQTIYARSAAIVVDTIAPEVTELVDGGTYPEGTEFQVVDINLESVKVNGADVPSGWNKVYQVSANGTSTSCVVKVKDKAGNETTYSITISRNPAEDGIISENGTYSLKKNVKYQLGEGKWQVGGDKSVYTGGSIFYVKKDGNYTFTKR